MTEIERILEIDNKKYKYFSQEAQNDIRVSKQPYCIRILLESQQRKKDNFVIKDEDIEKVQNWPKTCKESVEIPFYPSRVILQDLTGVPCIVDLASMRDAMNDIEGDIKKINPIIPVDLVIDHSVQVDYWKDTTSLEKNLKKEMERNHERFEFLKWGANNFTNVNVIAPGVGIVHQVNQEYLAHVIFCKKDIIEEKEELLQYFDSVIGTDSHTPMINGLGIVGWGVGGIEAEAVMLGQHISMILPQVIGFKQINKLNKICTATDIVLNIANILRNEGVVGKFIEFFGDGLQYLSVSDRATISNMSPEYGATITYFPIDEQVLNYLELTNRDVSHIKLVHEYCKVQNMYIDYNSNKNNNDIKYNKVIIQDQSSIEPTIAGPKRPHDAIKLYDCKKIFNKSLTNTVGFNGYGQNNNDQDICNTIQLNNIEYKQYHGSIVLAAITSCTNTSNPTVLVGAALLAKNAVKYGQKIAPYIKTSFAPGSHAVTKYLNDSNLLQYLDRLGFHIVGYGCTTCIGNSGDLLPELENILNDSKLIVCSILSGNRNFEGRIHPLTKANFLSSPALVVAYALAGKINIDFNNEPLGYYNNKSIYLKDIWPSKDDIDTYVYKYVTKKIYQEIYNDKNLLYGNNNKEWNSLHIDNSLLYKWDIKSTYIHKPPYFNNLSKNFIPDNTIKDIINSYCLLLLGDSITTDHISPAGKIAVNSPAAKYLQQNNIQVSEFNTYGSRRGNDEIMVRGTFANPRIINHMLKNNQHGSRTIYVPDNEELNIFDAVQRYNNNKTVSEKQPLIVIGGSMYGSGSSRDWAAKGPYMLGIRVIIAISFERIHRSNLIGMGILPCEFIDNQNATILGLNGFERYNFYFSEKPLICNQIYRVVAHSDDNTSKEFFIRSRIDTAIELEYYKYGGILPYVLLNLANS